MPCVNPCYVALAKPLLGNTAVRICTVIGFPLGANTPATKAAETRDALKNGCDEFDMGVNIGALKDGRDEYVMEDIRGVVDTSGGRTVKGIVETGLLPDEEKARATRLACREGARFVKTCTGMSEGAANVADVRLMRENADAGASRLGASAGAAIVREWRERS